LLITPKPIAQAIVTRKKAQTKRGGKSTNTLRIIGGEWRSRKLAFVDAPGLRPTPDRIRETLFNWVQTHIHGARCLDMFAGTGALGLEALSRGAEDVVFVEKNKTCAQQLKQNIELLKANANVIEGDALVFLNSIEKPKQAFDLVFLDPPYRQQLLSKSLNYLIDETLIDKNSLIYLEHESEESFDWSKYGLAVLKEANAGQVHSFLLELI